MIQPPPNLEPMIFLSPLTFAVRQVETWLHQDFDIKTRLSPGFTHV
jgi:hypothetical protein